MPWRTSWRTAGRPARRRQISTIWQDVRGIPDPRRYGHGNPSEHQAEAVAFAVHFLQSTAAPSATDGAALLEQYELLVPGTGAVARYLALQPIYAQHPLPAPAHHGRAELSPRR